MHWCATPSSLQRNTAPVASATSRQHSEKHVVQDHPAHVLPLRKANSVNARRESICTATRRSVRASQIVLEPKDYGFTDVSELGSFRLPDDLVRLQQLRDSLESTYAGGHTVLTAHELEQLSPPHRVHLERLWASQSASTSSQSVVVNRSAADCKLHKRRSWRRPALASAQTTKAHAAELDGRAVASGKVANAPSLAINPGVFSCADEQKLFERLRRRLVTGRAKAARVAEPTDVVQCFIDQLGNTPVLSKADEQALATVVQRGMQLQNIRASLKEQLGRAPSNSEIAQQAGLTEPSFVPQQLMHMLEAKELMVEYNTRLVISVAKKFRNKGVALPDLIMEGNEGLRRAIEKFDASKGFKFSTYAHWWIRHAMARFVCAQSRVVRVPVHVYEWSAKIARVAQELNNQPGRLTPASDDEIGQVLGLSTRKVQLYRKALMPVKSLDAVVSTASNHRSETNADTLLETLSDEEEETSENKEWRMNLIKEDINVLLNTLHPRERNVLRMRYGLHLDEGRNMTFTDIGQAYGLTRERIRQIEDKALRKLQKPWRAKLLRTHMYNF